MIWGEIYQGMSQCLESGDPITLLVCCRLCGRHGDEGTTRRRRRSFRHSVHLRPQLDSTRGPSASRKRHIPCRQFIELRHVGCCGGLHTAELLREFTCGAGGRRRNGRSESVCKPAVCFVQVAHPENSHPNGCRH